MSTLALRIGLFLLAATLAIPALALEGSPEAPYAVHRQEIKIAMPDGVHLYACLSMPERQHANEKFPALLTTDPYAGKCSTDPGVTAGRPWYAQYAEAGYAVVYVHVRGTGLSEGVFPPREYSEQELDDAVAVIAWLAKQPWSTGKVGMFGASWSGFNSLQVAMRNPPALKAIIPHVATEDIYHEDVHYDDGIFRFDDYNGFADLQLITSPPPADPLDEDTLRKRFDQPPYSLTYLKHQRDGDFWRRSIRLDQPTGHLTVPTLMIGGWYDGYRMAIERVLEHAQGPVRAVVGPWIHEMNFPAPAADLGRVAVQWWDYWLKGKHNSASEGPQLIAYMRRPYAPNARIAAVPGEWRAEQKWPPSNAHPLTLYLGADRHLHETAVSAFSETLRYVATSGSEAGIWWGDPAPDQRRADAESLVYETEPLTQELDLLGSPLASLKVSTSATQANWMVRLEDVAPDGAVTQITGAAINGTHRNSGEKPEPLIPQETYSLDIPLKFTSWIFEPGHRIRLAVSNALFPMFWPTPQLMTTRLQLGGVSGSRVSLPLIPPTAVKDGTAAADVGSQDLSVVAAAAVPLDEMGHWIGPANIHRDVLTGTTTVNYGYGYSGLSLSPGDTMFQDYETSDADPAHARTSSRVFYERKWQDHLIRWDGETEITSDANTFHYKHHRELRRDGTVVREKSWTEDVPRDFQ